MNEVKAHLKTADELLAKLSAQGDALMIIAAARQELLAAFDLIPKEKEQKQEQEEQEGENG